MATDDSTDPAVLTHGSEPVRYVVVVHGMGEQRRNATLVDVIMRFAEATRGRTEPSAQNSVTLGRTGPDRTWTEFEGIPARGDATGAFLPIRAESGENLRFADVDWSDITDAAVQECAEPAEKWIASTLERAAARAAPAPQDASETPPSRHDGEPPVPPVTWLAHLVHVVRGMVLLMRPLLRFWKPELTDKVFRGYLADVQVYAECPEVRGRAIARFHERLQRIAVEHDEAEARSGRHRDLRITVLAHSLGSVLALDALAWAHAGIHGDAIGARNDTPQARAEARREALGKRLPGYAEELAAQESRQDEPAEPWIEKVDSLVTMGSPLEKFVALWPENYAAHLDTDEAAPGDIARARGSRIRHYNFLEEMDLVADPLLVLRTSPLYQTLFDAKGSEGEPSTREWAYLRDTRPFLAHVQYWKDTLLFGKILRGAIRRGVAEGEAPSETLDARDPGKEAKRIWSNVYDLAPAIIALVLGGLFAAMISAEGTAMSAITTTVFWLLTTCTVVTLAVLTAWFYVLSLRRRQLSEAPFEARPFPSPVLWVLAVCVSACAFVALTSVSSQGLLHRIGAAVALLLFLSAVMMAFLMVRRRRGDARSILYTIAAFLLPAAVVYAAAGLGIGKNVPAILTSAVLSGILLWLVARATATSRSLARFTHVGWRPYLGSMGYALALWLVLVVGMHVLLDHFPPEVRESLGQVVDPAIDAATAAALPYERLFLILFSITAVWAFLLTTLRFRALVAARLLQWDAWAKTELRDHL